MIWVSVEPWHDKDLELIWDQIHTTELFLSPFPSNQTKHETLLSFSARMEQMKLRHLEEFTPRPPHITPPQGEHTHTQNSFTFVLKVHLKMFPLFCLKACSLVAHLSTRCRPPPHFVIKFWCQSLIRGWAEPRSCRIYAVRSAITRLLIWTHSRYTSWTVYNNNSTRYI